MYSVNTDGEILLKLLRLKVEEVSGPCLTCHQQKSDEIVKVGKGGTWARVQTSGPLHSTLNGFHTTTLWSGFWICLFNIAWLFLGWTEVFPFWNSPIFFIAKKFFDFVFPTWRITTYFSSDREFHFIDIIVKKFCKTLPLAQKLQRRKK